MDWEDFTDSQHRVLYETTQKIVNQWPDLNEHKSQITQIQEKILHDAVYRDPNIMAYSLNDFYRYVSPCITPDITHVPSVMMEGYQQMHQNVLKLASNK
jgi:hypothetical protein